MMQPFLLGMYRLPGCSLSLSLPLSVCWCYITKDQHRNRSTGADCYQPLTVSHLRRGFLVGFIPVSCSNFSSRASYFYADLTVLPESWTDIVWSLQWSVAAAMLAPESGSVAGIVPHFWETTHLYVELETEAS